MKKGLTIVLCLVAVFCLASCGTAEKSGKSVVGEFKEYKVGNYAFSLPATYEFNDLKEVKAEPSCIAMLTDAEGKLPELWIYEDECEGTTLKEHVMNIDKVWNFSEFSFYSKDDVNFARTLYYEDWYGKNLINENYYRIGNSNKVLCFDFAYTEKDDSDIAHKYIVAVAESLGF